MSVDFMTRMYKLMLFLSKKHCQDGVHAQIAERTDRGEKSQVK